MPHAPTIHIVDDDDAVRDALSVLLTAEGLGCRAYPSGGALLAALPIKTPGCVVTDVHMDGMSGLELLRRLRDAGEELPVVVITGRTDRTLAEAATSGGAVKFLEKPFGPDEFVSAVRAAIAA